MEIAEQLGVAQDTVNKWRHRHVDTFPAPRWYVSGFPAWEMADVRAWMKRTGRA
jgi:predicted DNA-binding transcriptional regulator AlpA